MLDVWSIRANFGVDSSSAPTFEYCTAFSNIQMSARSESTQGWTPRLFFILFSNFLPEQMAADLSDALIPLS